MTKTILSQTSTGNFTWVTKTHSHIIWMQNYTIGRQKIMKIKHEDVGLSKIYQRDQLDNAFWCPSFQKYLKEKLGNTLLQCQSKHKMDSLFVIKRGNHRYFILNKYPKTQVNMTDFNSQSKYLQVKLLDGGIITIRGCNHGQELQHTSSKYLEGRS